MSKLKIGIVGKGYFGKKIFDVLKDVCEVVFFTGREFDISYDIDWAIVASSNDSHFNICKLFIENGINVFVEKPICKNSAQAKELIKLAKKNKVKLYVDDVFMHHPLISNLKKYNNKNFIFKWQKYGTFNDDIYYNLCYHDIYILLNFGHELKDKIVFETNKINEKTFRIGAHKFSYNRVSKKKNKEAIVAGRKFNFLTDKNPLKIMFTRIFQDKVSFNENNLIALKTLEVIERLAKNKPKVAVVGAGIFGISAALSFDKEYKVSLYEKNDDILQNASSINQYRLHRGYHYPRSIETALSAKNGLDSFLKQYDCAIENTKQYYAIARNSKVSPDDFEKFMKKVDLQYKKIESDLVSANVESLYQVNEKVFDPNKLYHHASIRLKESKIELKLGSNFNKRHQDKFDYVVNATYSNYNEVTDKKRELQFELCEKPLVKLPNEYRNIGIVVMDGPFTCIDPYSDTGLHVMGNVVHAIHHRSFGFKPEIPDGFNALLNNGIIKDPPITNWDKFTETAKYFFKNIDNMEHIGSMFTVRAVLPNRDHDDARPTLITTDKRKVFNIFSGKIVTAVEGANELMEILRKT